MPVSDPDRSAVSPPKSGRRSTTPPKYAERRGVGVNKILELIKSGQLAAINMATSPDGRPRWVLDEEEIARFEESRRSIPANQQPTPRVRKRAAGVKEFF